jgi:hypothetical protein
MKPTEPSLRAPSARALGAEQRERRERDAALTDDEALVAYEAKWQRKLAKLQRAFPARWRVAGLSDEEVRDLLTLRLLEAVRRADAEELALARPGREWGLLVAQRELRALRKSFRLDVVLADLGEARLPSRAVSQEDAWLEHEAARSRGLAQARAERGLSKPQRRWLGAFKASAEQGAFFEASAEPNLSEPSRALGKHRSSALRAYRELQARFSAELARVE